VRLATRVIVLALVIPLGFLLCSRRSKRADQARSANIDHASFRARDTTRTLGAGDVRITSTDQSIELSLVGDSIVTGFGPAMLDRIKAKTDTATVKGTGFGARIEKMVKSTVAGALSHQLVFPVRSVSDVRYENGRLEFYNANGSQMHLYESTKVDGKDASMTFAKDDADRFIAAFHARKAAVGP
jgi:hypothetical protein